MLNLTDRAALIAKGLTYGDMDKGFIDRLWRNAQKLTTQMVKHYTGRDVRVDDTYFSMPVPPNIAEVQQIVEELVRRPGQATTFVPMLDLLVFERFLKNREGSDWVNKLFPYSDVRDRLALVHEFLRVLRSIEAIPDQILGTNKKNVADQQPGIEKPSVAPHDGQMHVTQPVARAADQVDQNRSIAAERSNTDQSNSEDSVAQNGGDDIKASGFEPT